MKSIFTAACVLLPLAVAIAQTTETGVYLTASDFENNKLSAAVPCTEKIRVNPIFDNAHIIIGKGANAQRFTKSSLYGYSHCHTAYRIYNKNTYEVAGTEGFYIYTREVLVQGKGVVKQVHYYFSTTADGIVQELTIANLKKAFPKNDAFHNFLDDRLKGASDLYTYDSARKQFKVSRLYTESIAIATSRNASENN
ncbi:MAG TPA: hypothetical protein VIN08_15020 [Ohtaekwangia sp.]|uniref:hypothetical protein n=1 Tax=Ohtaekwangia sp. TaxID=2066019 RepID=UPI002F92A6CC